MPAIAIPRPCFALLILIAALVVPAEAAARKRASDSSSSSSSVSSVFGRTSSARHGRSLVYDVGDECGKCAFDTFYFYESGSGDRLRPDFTGPPGDCVLAAIRDHAALRGAQSAIPEGEVALTQGYFPFDDLAHYCKFGNEDGEEKSLKIEQTHVISCGDYHYNEFFVNWEDSHVPDDYDCWVNATFPIPIGKVHVGIGADGALRPISQLNENDEEWDGAIYECCPNLNDICNEDPPPDTDN